MEVLTYGIPVIIAYQDTDLDGIESDVLLYLPNTEYNISSNMEKIHDFAYRMMGRRVERKLIAPLIDQLPKEEKRLEFIKMVSRSEAM